MSDRWPNPKPWKFAVTMIAVVLTILYTAAFTIEWMLAAVVIP